MLLRVTAKQTKFLLRQKEAVFTVTLLLWLVIGNYLGNVWKFRGTDVSQMYQSMKLLTLSYNRVYDSADMTLLITMLYPFLVAVPAGFSYIRGHRTGEEVFLVTRIGRNTYLAGELLSAFLVTAVVFCIPFLFEIVITAVSFPIEAQGDLSNWGLYSPEYARMVDNYVGKTWYLSSPIVYAVLGTLCFGIVSGILGMFTVGISVAFPVKYRVLLLLPAAVVLNGTAWLDAALPKGMGTVSWYEYLLLFNDSPKYVWFPVVGATVILGMLLVCCRAGRKRELL